MLSLAIAVVAIALPDSLNPSLIAADLLLVSEQNPRRRTIAFALSVWTVTFVFGLALALGLGDLILSLVPKPGATLKYELITAAGIALLTGGTVILVRREALTSTEPSPDGIADKPRGSPILLGAGIGGLELLTAFPYFAAIALIVGSNVSPAGRVFLLVLYCVVYTLPLIGIAAVCAVMGQRATDLLRPALNVVVRHWPIIVGPLAIAVGIGVATLGIVRLNST